MGAKRTGAGKAPRTQRGALAGLWIAFVMLAAIALFEYRTTRAVLDTTAWVGHTHEVLETIGDLREAMVEAAALQGDYTLAGDVTRLPLYANAIQRADADRAELRRLTADNAARQPNLDALEADFAERIAILDEAIAARRAAQRPGEEEVAKVATGADAARRVFAILEDIASEERRLLALRDTATTSSVAFTNVVQFAGTLASFGILLVGFERLQRSFREVAEKEEELDRFFTLSLDMLCVIGLDGHFKRLNPAFDVLGHSRDELMAKEVLDFIHPDDRARSLAEAPKLLAGAPSIHFEVRFRCKDGSYRWLLWTTALSPSGVLYATARDITELKAINAELVRAKNVAEAANEELEAFSYSVAHDLRAPLRAIDGFGRALQEEYAGALDADGLDYLSRVRTAAQHMGRLIDGLLGLSRVTRVDLVREVVDLSHVVRESAARLRDAHPARQVEVVVQEGLVGHGDPQLLSVAIDNLLGNAWKFTAGVERARIEVGQILDPGEPAFFVRDNGAGFDQAYAHKLFVAFQRLHQASEFEGTGIGLALVNRIVRRHRGRVWAEGRVGLGATFYFTL